MKTVNTTNAPAAVGPYSQAVVSGNMVYCSGQIPLIPGTSNLVTDDVAEATKQCIRNLSAVLEAAGSSLSKVVKCSIFILDMDKFGVINGAYEEMFGDHRPARAVVQVCRLPKDALVEIECIAEI